VPPCNKIILSDLFYDRYRLEITWEKLAADFARNRIRIRETTKLITRTVVNDMKKYGCRR